MNSYKFDIGELVIVVNNNTITKRHQIGIINRRHETNLSNCIYLVKFNNSESYLYDHQIISLIKYRECKFKNLLDG